MYSLDINFLKDRPIYHKNADKKSRKPVQLGNVTPIYAGVGVGLLFPILVGGGWWLLQMKSGELASELQKLEQENTTLDAKIARIKRIQQETKAITAETQALVTVFDRIRPWSAMLEDLSDRIPANVQIESLKQTPPIIPPEGEKSPNPIGGIEITGMARSFNDVNDFLLSLQQSKFLNAAESKIITAQTVDAPLPANATPSKVPIKPPQVVKYTIKSSLDDVPASELIRELEKKGTEGTVGLVTRLRSIQQTGVIPK
jgi:type IV pilus assembly protein PilN